MEAENGDETKGVSRSLAATLLATLALAAAALAAAPKLPLRAKVYSTGGYQGGVSVNLVINATNPRIVQAGPAHMFGMVRHGWDLRAVPHRAEELAGDAARPDPLPVVHAQALARALRLLDIDPQRGARCSRAAARARPR